MDTRRRGRRTGTPWPSRRSKTQIVRVTEAGSGMEALDLLASHPEIRVVFMDIVMPSGMSGDEVADTARIPAS
ncbi:hypothetical protein [Phyllobacterium sp. SB3]|uniref:hypothetical protein n=1 Tax=Phyllobacterium sp. SB3 TaxID=3156073 RepID=UPI0032AEDD93